MNAPRIFMPHNPLADRLHDARGVDAHTATQAAQVAIRLRKPEGFAEIERALAMLSKDLTAFRAPDDQSVVFKPSRVYAGADSIVGLATYFDMPGLGLAASSLCKLLTEEDGVRQQAIAVHIEAMVMISKDERMAQALMPGLRQLSDRPACSADVLSDNATRVMALSVTPSTKESIR